MGSAASNNSTPAKASCKSSKASTERRPLVVRNLPESPYQTIWEQMRDFTNNRTKDTPDELWLLQHPPVLTQGQAGKPEHLLIPTDIPVVQTDRGGQITYHGPGQLVAYILVDLKRRDLSIRCLVHALENVMINVVAEYGVTAERKDGAPGIYIDGAKIGSIGLRVRRGCTYHGIAFNIDMDLTPFSTINPCGFNQLKVVQLKDFAADVSLGKVQQQFAQAFCAELGYCEENT